MSGSLCNSFGSLSAGVHERPRKWCARQRLRTKRTFVPLWPGQAIGGTFVSLCSIAFFAIGGDAATMVCLFPPPQTASPQKKCCLSQKYLVRRSSRSAWPPSFSSLQSSCSSMFQGGFLFLYRPSNQWEGECAHKCLWDYPEIFRQPIYLHFYPGKQIIYQRRP